MLYYDGKVGLTKRSEEPIKYRDLSGKGGAISAKERPQLAKQLTKIHREGNGYGLSAPSLLHETDKYGDPILTDTEREHLATRATKGNELRAPLTSKDREPIGSYKPDLNAIMRKALVASNKGLSPRERNRVAKAEQIVTESPDDRTWPGISDFFGNKRKAHMYNIPNHYAYRTLTGIPDIKNQQAVSDYTAEQTKRWREVAGTKTTSPAASTTFNPHGSTLVQVPGGYKDDGTAMETHKGNPSMRGAYNPIGDQINVYGSVVNTDEEEVASWRGRFRKWRGADKGTRRLTANEFLRTVQHEGHHSEGGNSIAPNLAKYTKRDDVEWDHRDEKYDFYSMYHHDDRYKRLRQTPMGRAEGKASMYLKSPFEVNTRFRALKEMMIARGYDPFKMQKKDTVNKMRQFLGDPVEGQSDLSKQTPWDIKELRHYPYKNEDFDHDPNFKPEKLPAVNKEQGTEFYDATYPIFMGSDINKPKKGLT